MKGSITLAEDPGRSNALVGGPYQPATLPPFSQSGSLTKGNTPSAPSYNPNQYSSPAGPAAPTKNSSAYKQTSTLYGGRTSSTSNTANNAKKQIDAANKAAQKAYDQQRQREIDAINGAFGDEQNRLQGLNSQVSDQYNQANAQFDQYLPQFQGQVANERQTQMGSLANTETQRKLEAEHALTQVRQNLSDLQRRQNALLGASGGFNSSAAPAAGEMFSRQAFQGLGQVQQQRDAALSQVADQRNKVNDFYNSKLIDGEQKIQQSKAALQQQFMQQLNAISSAQGQSAAAKRQATVDAWRNYTNVAATLNSQLTQQKISLDQWAAQAHDQLNQISGTQNQLGTVSNVNAVAMDTSLGAQDGGGTQWGGIDTGAWDPNKQLAGAYDPMTAQYQGQEVSGITVPNVVQRSLARNSGGNMWA